MVTSASKLTQGLFSLGFLPLTLVSNESRRDEFSEGNKAELELDDPGAEHCLAYLVFFQIWFDCSLL